eukprot:g3801.t1
MEQTYILYVESEGGKKTMRRKRAKKTKRNRTAIEDEDDGKRREDTDEEENHRSSSSSSSDDEMTDDDGDRTKSEQGRRTERLENAAFAIGDFVHKGHIEEFSSSAEFSSASTPILEIIRRFQIHQHRLPFYALRNDLPHKSRIYETLAAFSDVVTEAVEKLSSADEEISKLQRCDMLDGVEDDLSNVHFEFNFKRVPEGLKSVRVLLHKTFLGGGTVRCNAVYARGALHVVLSEGQGEHGLSDATFPEMNAHGDGYDLKEYDAEASAIFGDLIVYGDFRRDKEKAAAKTADIDEAPAAEEAHGVAVSAPPRALIGYNQTYVLHKQPPHAPASPFRNVFFRCGNFCYAGNLDMGVDRPSLGALPSIVPTLQQQQSKLNYVGTIGDLLTYGRWKDTLLTLETSAKFMMEKMTNDEDVQDALESALGSSPGDKAFFELRTESDMPGLEDVEMLATKTYMKGMVFVLIFFEGSWYAHVRSASGSRCQPLLDTDFPDLSTRGRGFSLGSSNGDTNPYFLQLYLWDGEKGVTAATMTRMDSGTRSDEDEGTATKRRVRLGARDASPKLDTAASSAAEEISRLTLADYNDYEDYTQTYVVMRAIGAEEGQSTTREVIFRYGNWNYAGSIEMGTVRLTIDDLVNVVPILQLQQSNLKYTCKKGDVPKSSRFHLPMLQMSEATQYLGDRMTASAEELDRLARADPSSYGWMVSEQKGGQEDAGSEPSTIYFQLRTDNAHVSRDVEYMSSKTVVRGVQMIVIYFGGSYYAHLTDAEGSHSLLNTRFPDVTWKARGHHFDDEGDRCRTIVSRRAGKRVDVSHFRGMSVWEGAPPTVNEELAEEVAEREERAEAKMAEEEEDTVAIDDDATSARSNATTTNESKVAEREVDTRRAKLETMTARRMPSDNSGPRERRTGGANDNATEKKKKKKVVVSADAFKVRAPHHLSALKPLGSSSSSGGGAGVGSDKLTRSRLKLQRILGSSSGPAPWEKGGRPLLLSKKK